VPTNLKEAVSKFLESEPYSIIWAITGSRVNEAANTVTSIGNFSCSCGAILWEKTVRTDPINEKIVHKFLIHVAKMHMGHV